VPPKNLFRIFATSFHFYFTWEVDLPVVHVLSFSCATRVRLSMSVGWHFPTALFGGCLFSREWRCERVGPRRESFLRLIRSVTIGNLTARPTYMIDRLTLACEVVAELLGCVACMNCGVTLYTNSELCVLSGWTVFPSRQDQWDSKRVEVWTQSTFKHPWIN